MYGFRWAVFLIHRGIYLFFRILSSRLWFLIAFLFLLSAYGTRSYALSQGVFLGGLTVWFVARLISNNLPAGERPQRPLGYKRPVKEKLATVATSLAVSVDSPSVDIARLRLSPKLQAIMVPAKGLQR